MPFIALGDLAIVALIAVFVWIVYRQLVGSRKFAELMGEGDEAALKSLEASKRQADEQIITCEEEVEQARQPADRLRRARGY